MSGHVAPSSRCSGSPGVETMNNLQQKLASSEQDANNLLKNLSDMGFSSDKKTRGSVSIPPFRMQTADPEVLKKNYETLVARCCKTESAIQSVKLSLLRVQAEKDLSLQEKSSKESKLMAVTEAFEKEIKRLSRENEMLKKECEETEKRRQEAQEMVKKMQRDLEEGDTLKAESSGALDEAKCSIQKLERRLSEMKDELSRESELRGSMEESHATLLTRIQDMENIVDKEREEVKSLTADCNSWKKETAKAHGNMQTEMELRAKAEESHLKLVEEKENLLEESRGLLEDKQLLMSEMGRMQSQYMQLNEKLDQAHRLINERQMTREQLERENKQLLNRFREAAEQNAQLVANYEDRLENERAELLGLVKEGESSAKLQELLTKEVREKAQTQQKYNQVQEEITQVCHKMAEKDEEIKRLLRTHENEMSRQKLKIAQLMEDREKALKEKDRLLDEVNLAVDSMSDERVRLEGQVEEGRLEAQGLQQSKAQLEEELQRMSDRLTSLTGGQSCMQQMEISLAKMAEEKQKLAYDKGRLESNVRELKGQLQELASSSQDACQLRRSNSALENKCTKLQSEVTELQMQLQNRESRLRHAVSAQEQRDSDFELAIKARDEAVTETKKLLKHLDALEETHKTKVQNLERGLSECRSDNKSLAGTLESVMQSHAQLQSNMENIQSELGRKDAQLDQMTTDKTELDNLSQKTKKELESMGDKLSSFEDLEMQMVQPLKKALNECKADNAELASSMEALLRSNTTLQKTAEKAQNEVSQKKHLLESVNKARDQDSKQHRSEMRTQKERMENLKRQLLKARDSTSKKSNQELNDVRRQLEESLSKNGSLSRANTELRHKITEQDLQLKEQRDKVSRLQGQVDHFGRVRKKHEESLSSVEDFKERLTDLERTKNEYVQKNKQQAKTIESFMNQITDIQVEISNLAKSHLESTELLVSQEESRNQERLSLEHKYKISRGRERELMELHEKTEEKLREANDESIHMSSSLHDAHDWFTNKFESLQEDLARSRRCQSSLEKDYLMKEKQVVEEQKKATQTAEKARALIKASRETIGRLASFAEVAQSDTQQQLREMRSQLDQEKQRSEQLQKKLYNLQDSSLRHTEELAKELDFMKTHSSIPCDMSLNSF